MISVAVGTHALIARAMCAKEMAKTVIPIRASH